ncbi:MAG: hypothetical protein HUJ29_07830 [Gammaproteobacteria bacterium]|nr:hypothetical protein [Gammaproteobacteria bacterium]
MRLMLFNQPYHEYLSIRYRFLLKVILAVTVICLLLLSSWLYGTYNDAIRYHQLETKIMAKLGESQGGLSDERTEDMDRFLSRIGRINDILGTTVIAPIEMLNVLEATLPDMIRIESIEYQSGKDEFRLRARTMKQEQVTEFLEELDRYNFKDVLLTGQSVNSGVYQFDVVVKLS